MKNITGACAVVQTAATAELETIATLTTMHKSRTNNSRLFRKDDDKKKDKKQIPRDTSSRLRSVASWGSGEGRR